jgi:frataxin-like iron-binding protein CyaY
MTISFANNGVIITKKQAINKKSWIKTSDKGLLMFA